MGSVRCYHPGGVHFHTPITPSSQNGFGSRGFEQPPYGYPQYDEGEGEFSDGSRYVCVCVSTDSPADPVHKDQITALTQAGTITSHT
eukprot:COSAG06_NODE_41280_length_393_cov_0.646259_1_plen_86_part_10